MYLSSLEDIDRIFLGLNIIKENFDVFGEIFIRLTNNKNYEISMRRYWCQICDNSQTNWLDILNNLERLTVTILKPIQRPRIPPEFATNQMTGIFWSRLQWGERWAAWYEESAGLTWSWSRQDSWCRHWPGPGCPGCSGIFVSPDSSLNQVRAF